MITTNGKYVIASELSRASITNGALTSFSGSTGYDWMYDADATPLAASTQFDNYDKMPGVAIMVSSDSTATENQATMSNELTITRTSAVRTSPASGPLVYTFTCTNSSGSAFTIRSVGLVTTYTNRYVPFLIAIQAVPERVVQPGESFTYSVTLG